MFEWLCKKFRKKEEPRNVSLQNFITESLVQICDGVRDAQNRVTGIPYNKADEKYYRPYIMPTPRGGREKDIYEVQFDVAVTASNTTTNKDSAAIKSDILIVGFDDTKSANRIEVNRMQFSIPIIYPSMPVPHPGSEK